ncbi:related to Chitinase [Melanopsichium pennsylvanicum]|uniref:Related to Chitinase n=2 Tax=Melanopsichium pennsylvanicum TaxID=63383 RepID=A0AAJ4XSR5_9BASI|nr:related to Chitinase [Melanopsichium pennsylvanicum 4]SNX87949.1 related to Chitinase [Melanopsichium pennsylvanicum]
MKLLPLRVLALVSLFTTSTLALQDDITHASLHLTKFGADPIISDFSHRNTDSDPSSVSKLNLVADRLSSPPTSLRLSIQRRSLWQVLFGQGGKSGKKRRAAPSARFLPADRRRTPASSSRKIKRRNGSCKMSSSVNSTSVSTPTSTSSSSSPSPTNSGNDTRTSTNKIMAGYWPDWVNSEFPPTAIDFSKFDIVNYAFAIPTAKFDLSIPTDSSGGLLKSFVSACKAGDTKAVLSLGGWGGSTYFSPAVRTAASRATFIRNINKYYTQYNLDGIDIDWEYPGQTGAGNQLDPSDTANFQTFLTELRASLPQGALITAAVSHQPWISSSGQPVESVARAAASIDYIMIMNYDVWGSSSNPGPNAPLANLCGNSSQPGANAAAGVKAWSAAGMPRDKILLGIPAYGYINTSSKKVLRTRSTISSPSSSSASQVPIRTEKRAVTLTSMSGSTSEGQINFSTLVSQGALKLDSDGLYDGSGGFTKYWDDCSDTPYLSDGTKIITYDDTSSIYDKGAFVNAAGIGGMSMWSLDGDTKSWALTNSAVAGMSSTTAIQS